jgi:prepilin-type N-terminal cleavage/methylation domain-containing protein
MNGGERGFTLVEMMMALAITAAVALAAMTALDQLTDADARATQNIESTVGVYRALQQVKRDVADATALSVATDRFSATQADGSVVFYTLLAGATELHRTVYANALLVPILVIDTLSPVGYDARGHVRDGDYRASAIVQGAGAIAFTAIVGPRTGSTTGVKVSVQHATSHGRQIAPAIAMCWDLVEADAKP